MKADIIQHDDFETARDYQRIAQALTYVDENFQDQPSLTEIADQVGLCEFHFQRLFSRWVGINPKQFLKHIWPWNEPSVAWKPPPASSMRRV